MRGHREHSSYIAMGLSSSAAVDSCSHWPPEGSHMPKTCAVKVSTVADSIEPFLSLTLGSRAFLTTV